MKIEIQCCRCGRIKVGKNTWVKKETKGHCSHTYCNDCLRKELDRLEDIETNGKKIRK